MTASRGGLTPSNKTPRKIVGLITLFTAVLLLALPAAAAPQTRIVDAGWWWRAQTGVGPKLPPPTNVEEGQLMISVTPEGAQAIGAVSGELEDDQVNPLLTLTIAEDQGASDAIVLACQAGSAWIGSDAGTWGAAPKADCDGGSVNGIRSDDGTSMTFPLGPLQFNDKFNVVIVPGVIPGEQSQEAYSLVFEGPTDADIATQSGSAPPATTTPTTARPSTTTTAFIPPRSNDELAAPPTTFTPPPTTAVLAVVPALEPEGRGQTATAPVINEATTPVAAPIVPATESSRTAARILGAAVLLAAAGAAFAVGQGRLGGAAASAAAPVEGGLGRFRQERFEEPNAIS